MKAVTPERNSPPIGNVAAPSNHPLQACFEEFRGELLGMVYHTVGNMDDAREVMQEAFLKCWKHRDQVASLDNVRAWVFRITINTARDTRKTAWSRRRRPMHEDMSVPTRSATAEETAIENEQVMQLRVAITRLTPEQRDVFLLRQNGHMTYEQISEAIAVPIGTVKTRMRAALVCLRVSVGNES